MPLKDINARRAYDRMRGKKRKAAGYVAPSIQENIERVNTLKATIPCKDCGQKFPPVCMDFDHLRDKFKQVSTLVYSGVDWEVIADEIAKCEIVCANCHRIRTQLRKVKSRKEAAPYGE